MGCRNWLGPMVVLLLPACHVVPIWAQDVAWQLVTDQAGWSARDSQGELVFDNKLWIFGGWASSFEAPPRDEIGRAHV